MSTTGKELLLPAGWAHLPMPLFKRDPEPSEPRQAVFINCYPSRTRHPMAPEWSHLALKLVEQDEVFALRVELSNVIDRRSVAITLASQEARALAFVTRNLLAEDAEVGESYAAWGYPEIASTPESVCRSMLKSMLGKRGVDSYVTLLAYDRVAETKVTVALSAGQVPLFADMLWREPEAPATEDTPA